MSLLARSFVMRGLRAVVIALGLAGSSVASASAAAFVVEPSSFTLVPPVRNATITLTNLSSEPLRLQVRGLAWSENATGTRQLTPTSDVVVFPQLVTIPPMGTQRVRAAVLAPPSAIEQTYRIVIEDMPPLDEAVHAQAGERISMRTRFTLAVYVEPATPALAGRIEDIHLHDGVLSFAVRNVGNTLLSGNALSVSGRDASGNAVFADKIDRWYVLAGGRRVYTLDIGKSTCASVRKLMISPEAGSMLPAQTVDVNAACA
jgi:fimbrial chaperone protein